MGRDFVRTSVGEPTFTTRRASLAQWRSRAGTRDFKKSPVGGMQGLLDRRWMQSTRVGRKMEKYESND